MIKEILSLFDWRTLIFVAIIVSFITEAINQVTAKYITSNIILPVIALVVTLLRLPMEFAKLSDYQEFGLNVLFTVAMAILFYNYLGRYTIGKIFGLLKKKVDTEANVS